MRPHPALEFIVKMQSAIAWVVGAFFVLGGVYTWFAGPVPEYEGQSPGWVGLELIVAGVLAWLAVKSVLEILEILMNIERNTWALAKVKGEAQSTPGVERKAA